MKLVFDTNVLLSGMFTRGVCEALLDACWGNESHQLFACERILDEFAEHAQGTFHVPAKKLARAIAILRQQFMIVQPAKVPRNACRDPDDLTVLGTLVAARADCLVTGDKDLLVLKRYDDHPILTPRQCLELLRV